MTKLLTIMLVFLSSFAKAQTTYYISTSGNDANAGTSQSAPRKTIPTLKPKNTYLLKRGDTFYQKIKRVYNPTVGNTITVGAYGTGAKPTLNLYAVISSAAWVLDGGNIWKANLVTFSGISGAVAPAVSTGADVGFLKLNGRTIKGAKKKTKAALLAQWDFYCDATYLYVYSTSKPSSLASKIEAATDNSGIAISDNMTVQDIQIIGAGHHGIGTAKQNNIIIRNVDIAEIGGGYLTGTTTRYGNGIQLYDGGTNSIIENCTVKHVYDVAYTMQSASTSGILVFQNITFRNNVADSCEQSFELSMYNQANQPGYVNCKVTGNTFKNAGYSWGHYLRPHIRGIHIVSYLPAVVGSSTKFDLIFESNTYSRARDGLYYSSYGGTGDSPLPPFISRNNKIWLDSTTYIRMKIAGGATIYPWKVKTYQDFVNKTGKEVGSTWYVLGAAAKRTSSLILTTPTDSATYTTADEIKITASQSGDSANIKRVDFYNGNTLVGSDSSSPYSLDLKNLPEGNHVLTAKAIYKDGVIAMSNALTLALKAKALALLNTIFVDFSGKTAANANALIWKTNGGNSVEYFKIQRGKELTSFADIATIPAAAGTMAIIDYSFIDQAPAEGKNYYRIAQVDKNGAMVYSQVIHLDNVRSVTPAKDNVQPKNRSSGLGMDNVQIRPNPVSEIMSIQLSGFEKLGRVNISILSSSGVLIKSITSTSNSSLIQVDVSSLAPGTYVLQTTTSDRQVINKKFIKL